MPSPFLSLARTVNRVPYRCHFCSWIVLPLDSRYAIQVGGVELVRFCNQPCAEKHARVTRSAKLELQYKEAA